MYKIESKGWSGCITNFKPYCPPDCVLLCLTMLFILLNMQQDTVNMMLTYGFHRLMKLYIKTQVVVIKL